jgi:hypothetical protein
MLNVGCGLCGALRLFLFNFFNRMTFQRLSSLAQLFSAALTSAVVHILFGGVGPPRHHILYIRYTHRAHMDMDVRKKRLRIYIYIIG